MKSIWLKICRLQWFFVCFMTAKRCSSALVYGWYIFLSQHSISWHDQSHKDLLYILAYKPTIFGSISMFKCGGRLTINCANTDHFKVAERCFICKYAAFIMSWIIYGGSIWCCQRNIVRFLSVLSARGMPLEIERTDRCCSVTESVTAQICSGRNRTEPHTQIRASRRRPPWRSASRSQARR